MRKTKIVCTIGPASEDVETLKKLMLAGMDVARINFSHGGYEEQRQKVENIKKARKELNLNIPLMMDTKGPEIRIGKLENNEVVLKENDVIKLVNNEVLGNSKEISISYKDLYKELKIGNRVLIDDGLVETQVIEIKNEEIYCKVKNGGVLHSRKSVNIPNIALNLPSLTEKDKEDIKVAVREGFDFIAASFVRKVEDVLEIRKVLKQNGGEQIKIISKIENREGVTNFDEILDYSDGIMVARGDLSVEIPMEEVPVIQKDFIKKCYRQGKVVITATQMLESMINNPRPTRAEVSDISNAIYDVTGAIMLSGETATGKHPVECVEIMNKIAIATEESIDYWKRLLGREYDFNLMSYEFIANYSVTTIAMNTNARAIIAYTNTGNTARTLSSYCPKCPIYAITSNEEVCKQLSMQWGVIPKLFKEQDSIEDLINVGIEKLKEEGLLNKDDIVVVAGGSTILPVYEKTDLNKVLGGILKV